MLLKKLQKKGRKVKYIRSPIQRIIASGGSHVHVSAGGNDMISAPE